MASEGAGSGSAVVVSHNSLDGTESPMLPPFRLVSGSPTGTWAPVAPPMFSDDGVSMADDDQPLPPTPCPERPVRPTLSTPVVLSQEQLLPSQRQAQPGRIRAQEWELAPGILRNIHTEDRRNVAFSSAALRGNVPVQLTRDVFFKLITLEMGAVRRLEPDDTRIRCFSVASGRLEVEMPHAAMFEIGAHGVFIVPPFADVKLVNKHYDTAVLHVTAIEEE